MAAAQATPGGVLVRQPLPKARAAPADRCLGPGGPGSGDKVVGHPPGPRAHRAGRLRAGQQGRHLQAHALGTHAPQLGHHLGVLPPPARLPVHGHDVVALLQAGRLRGHGRSGPEGHPLPLAAALSAPSPPAASGRPGRGPTAAWPPGMTAAMSTGESPRSVKPKPPSPRVTWTGPTSRQRFLTENTERGPWGASRLRGPAGGALGGALACDALTPTPASWAETPEERGRPTWGPRPGQGQGTGAHQPVEDVSHLHPGEAGGPDLRPPVRLGWTAKGSGGSAEPEVPQPPGPWDAAGCSSATAEWVTLAPLGHPGPGCPSLSGGALGGPWLGASVSLAIAPSGA